MRFKKKYYIFQLFIDQNVFIVMYCLLVDDVVDFLGLIIEYDIEVVVFMEFFNSIEFVRILLFENLLKYVLYCINNDLIKILY